MLSSLLSTKLFIPPLRPDHIHRPRLVDALDAGYRMGRRMTLVSAPAGYGKTSLLSEWQPRLIGQQVPMAWLALEASDNDPQRFLHYLLAAVQTIFPKIGQNWIAQLDQPLPPAPVEVIAGLINEIAAVGNPLVLVLDDYHLITNSAIHEGIGFLVDHGSTNLHLVIASRHDPLLPLPRLRARGQVTEVRLKDLRFRPEESAAFVGKGMGLELTETDLLTLQERTEGWVTGLQLAAISLSDRENGSSDFIREFTGDDRHILDYLLEEVLARQPVAVQRFLLFTSMLEKFNPPLCDAILAGDREGLTESPLGSASECCQVILDTIDRANLFLIPLDNRHEWFRYHQLFREALCYRLQRQEGQRLPELHRRAAGWFDRNGHPTLAFDHALAAGDIPLAVDIAERWIDPLHFQGQVYQYRLWFQTLPAGVVASRPELLYRKARLQLLTGDLTGYEQSIEDLERCLERMPDPFPMRQHLWVLSATLRASLLNAQGDLAGSIAVIEKAAQILPPDDLGLHALVSYYRGLNYLRVGSLTKAETGYKDMFRISLIYKSYSGVFSGLAGMMMVAAYQGEARRALQMAQDFILEYQAEIDELPALGIVYGYMGEIGFLLNRLEEADAWLTEGLDRFQRGGILDDGVLFRLNLAEVKVTLGKNDEAESLIREADSLLSREVGERSRLVLGAIRSRVRLKQGNLTEPAQWADRYALETERLCRQDMQDNTLAWVWLAQGKALEALHFLETKQDGLEKGEIHLRLLENLALQALALQRLGSQAEACEKIQRAVQLAEPAGYDRCLVGLGLELAWLLARLKASLNPADRLQPYLGQLLAAFPEYRQTGLEAGVRSNVEALSPVNQEWIEGLSDREVEVLRLMARGLNNAQISEAMVVAESTVKKHINHIFSKLDVSNRTQALIKARERSLL